MQPLRFPEFDNETSTGIVGDVVNTLNSGVSVNSYDYPVESNDSVGILKTSSISNGFFFVDENKKVIECDLERVKNSLVQDTILVSRMNTPALVGEVGFIDKDYDNLYVPDRLWVLTTKAQCDPKWLTYMLVAPRAKSAIKNRATGTSASMKNISKPSFLNIKIPIPSFEEQQKIADFLSSVDKKISLLKEKHALLSQYKKGVMQKLFKQEIRFKDVNGNDFPDWQEKTMSQVLKPEVREVAKPSEKYLALGIRSHMKGTFQKPDSDPEAIAMDKLYVVRANDLVVNITFAWEGAIAIAQTEDDGGLVSHRFPTYTFKPDQATHRYFKHIIQLKRFKYMLDIISPGGAGRNRVLSKTEFLKLKWNLPSVKEQEKIADFLDTLDTKIELVNQQIELTQTFKKGLLQQMFV